MDVLNTLRTSSPVGCDSIVSSSNATKLNRQSNNDLGRIILENGSYFIVVLIIFVTAVGVGGYIYKRVHSSGEITCSISSINCCVGSSRRTGGSGGSSSSSSSRSRDRKRSNKLKLKKKKKKKRETGRIIVEGEDGSDDESEFTSVFDDDNTVGNEEDEMVADENDTNEGIELV
jgi:hypothetical protein